MTETTTSTKHTAEMWSPPQGSERVTLEEVCLPVEKVAPEDAPEKPFTYVDIASIDNFSFRITQPKTYLGKEAPSRARQRIIAGDTLLSTVRTYLRNIALVPPEYDGQVASTGFCVLRPSEAIHPAFLFYAVQTDDFISALNLLQRGTSYPAVRNDDVLAQVIVLPPLSEQRRIVAEIEKHFTRLDAAVAALQRARANLKRYRTSVLKAACEGRLVPTEAELARQEGRDYEAASLLLGRILKERRARWEAEQRQGRYREPQPPDTSDLPPLPEGWVWAAVEQLSWRLQYGTSAKASSEDHGTPVLRMGNIQDGALDFSDLKYLPNTHPEVPLTLLEPGDLLFNRTNSPELVGKSTVYHSNHRSACFASYLIRVRFIEGCSPDYVSACINSDYGRRYIRSVQSQQVGQANVNGTKLASMAIPLPPLAEQRRIVAEVERHMSVIQAAEAVVVANLKRAERLRQAILKRAFEGKLVPQDANDESASALLERIRVEREKARTGKALRPVGRTQRQLAGRRADT